MLPQYLAQYYYMMDGGDWGWGLAMMLFWTVVAFLVILLVARSVNGNERQDTKAKADDVLDIVRQRYAKGEISKEEFDHLKKDLQ